jgi:hypothetical protein
MKPGERSRDTPGNNDIYIDPLLPTNYTNSLLPHMQTHTPSEPLELEGIMDLVVYMGRSQPLEDFSHLSLGSCEGVQGDSAPDGGPPPAQDVGSENY